MSVNQENADVLIFETAIFISQTSPNFKIIVGEDNDLFAIMVA